MANDDDGLKTKIMRLKNLVKVLEDPVTATRLAKYIEELERELKSAH